MKMRDSRRRREGDPICRSGLIAAPRQRIAAQLAAYRRGASPDDPADLTTRCAGFIKPRHLNALVQVELIILRSHCNSGLYRRCTWRVNLGPFLLDEQLFEEERLVRDSAREYAQDKLMPRILMANRHERLDKEIMLEMGRSACSARPFRPSTAAPASITSPTASPRAKSSGWTPATVRR